MPYRNPPPLTHVSNRLEGRVIFVTGASSGIGAAAVRRFAEEGAIVMAAARRGELLEALASELRDEGHIVDPVICDVRDEQSVKAAIDKTLELHGRLDGAFNNAATQGAHRSLLQLTAEEFDEPYATNLRGVFFCMKYEIAAMLKSSDGGSIVNTSSVGGLIGVARGSAYGASKFGLEGLMKCAAMEFARKNIRVNSIAPGPTDTDMMSNFKTEESRAGLAATMPMNYIAHPDDMARAALFLLCDESRWITGVTLPCDGGYTAQ